MTDFQLRWPTQYGTITQQFGEHPENYARYGLPGHDGIDFMAPQGSEVYAAADGVVSEIHLDGNSDPIHKPYGNQIHIQHEGGYETIYAHLLQVLVTVGQAVHAGQIIGLADSTGNSTGSHLHLTLKKQGATQSGQTRFPYDVIDPNPYLQPFSGPGPVPPPPQPTLQVQVNSPSVGYLNVRDAPAITGNLIGRVPDGTLLDSLEPADVTRSKIGQRDPWLWVRVPGGQQGYVSAWYLRLPGPAIMVVVISPDVPLKVRSGPGVQYPILAQVTDGTQLQALESEDAVRSKVGVAGQWLHVQTSGNVVGYSAAWYLRLL